MKIPALIPVALLAVLLVACSSAPDTGGKVGTAATAPLRDLNVVQAAIPELLQQAQAAPYALPAGKDCAALGQAIAQLDEVLGADLDAPPNDAHKGLLERGGDAAGDAAVGALQRTAEGVIPFRGWIRKLSGAERYAKKVAAAITAGGVRRGFLKGLRAAQGCGA